MKYRVEIMVDYRTMSAAIVAIENALKDLDGEVINAWKVDA